MKKILLFSVISFLLFDSAIFAQNKRIIQGKVIDINTKEPIPFASVSIKHSSTGQNTDFEGNFLIQTFIISNDSLLISSIGYTSKSVYVLRDSLTQTLNIQLKPAEILLQEVKVYAGENPAYKIIRQAVAAKTENNYKKLEGFDYQSYNKIEVDANNISEKTQKKRITKKIKNSTENLGILTDDDGKTLLPIFISESISHFYFRNKPRLTKEVIEKTNIKGVGVSPGGLASQLIGSTFQQYNFYYNQVDVLGKNFSSPIADDWHIVYEYYLADSVKFGNDLSYKIDFTPKRKQDLAFAGTIWINKTSFTLSQIDATITKDANLNFIESIKIQQELEPFGKVWFPVKNRILIDVSEITNSSAGMLLKFNSYNHDINTTNIKETVFFDKAIENIADDKEDKTFWQKARPESFSAKEQLASSMIDSIKNIPSIRFYSTASKILLNNHIKLFRGIDLGPVSNMVAYNNIEGLRLQLGLRTNKEFSKKWIFAGYLTYGTKDANWKMGGEITKIISTKPWTSINIKSVHDIEQVGLRKEDLGLGAIFSAYLRFLTLQRPYYENENKFIFQREISKGVFTSVGFRTRSFQPLYPFSYRTNPSLGESSPLINDYKVSEFLSEITFAHDELSVINNNERKSFGTIKSPIITLKYIWGVKNVFNSAFAYHNFTIKYSHTLNWGYLGKTYYRAEAGAILGTVPYPLLKSHLGNESIFIVGNSFNLMNNFEFVSDRYLLVRYTHYFEGLFFNRLPLIKKLKWRTFTTGKFLVGALSDKNLQMTPKVSESGFRNFTGLSQSPYIELGYGINNIFRFVRVEAMHRLTYRTNPEISKVGLKFTFELVL